MPYSTAIIPLVAAEQTASGVAAVLDLGVSTTAKLRLDVASGSGSLAAVVETARSSTGPVWRTVDAFATAAGVASEERTFPGCDRYVRVRWTLATGPFTFGVAGERLVVYATPADMKRVLREHTLVRDQGVNYTDVDLDEFAQDATDELDGSLGAITELPLARWGRDLRRKTAELAVFFAMQRRGFSPQDPGGIALLSMAAAVRKWAEQVRENEIVLQHLTDASPEVEDAGGFVVTNTARGWGIWR